jgi:hypothetical protein
MSNGEHEATPIEVQERADREAIGAAEQLVLAVIAEQHPASLQDLRAALAHAELGDVDRNLLRVAIWRLLNSDRLQLTDDRRLEVAAG